MSEFQKTALYKGEVELLFNEKSHRYKISDKGSKPEYMPSVTTILGVLNKPAIAEWAARTCCDEIERELRELTKKGSFSIEQIFKIISIARSAHTRLKEAAAEIGTNTHTWLSGYWTQVMRDPGTITIDWTGLNEKTCNCINAALDWFNVHTLKPIAIEQPQYSRLYKICGTADFIGYIDGEFGVIDYKSTKAIWPEVALQMAPYAKFYEEEFGQLPVVRYALRLDKETGAFEAKKYALDTLVYDFDTFLAAFKLYDRLKYLRRKPKPQTDWIDALEIN